MPIVKTIDISPESQIAIWRLSDDDSTLLQSIELADWEKKEFQQIHNKSRQREWLGVRHALHELSNCPSRQALYKDEFGKPYFQEDERFISLSHCKGLALAMISSDICGVDVQKIEERISKVSRRVLSENEINSIQNDHKLKTLTLFWSAKEAIIKAYGNNKIDLRKNIQVDPFTYEDGQYLSTGNVQYQGDSLTLTLSALEYEGYIILTATKVRS